MVISIIPVFTIIQTESKRKEIFPMRDMKIRKMVLAALMAALTYVATMVVQIPSPMQGFVNLGDCCVLFLANARCTMKKTMKTESRKQIFL